MLPLIFASHLGLNGYFLCSLSCPSARSRGNLDRSTLRLPDFEELQSQKDTSTIGDEGMREAVVDPRRNSYLALHAWNLVFLFCFLLSPSSLHPFSQTPSSQYQIKGEWIPVTAFPYPPVGSAEKCHGLSFTLKQNCLQPLIYWVKWKPHLILSSSPQNFFWLSQAFLLVLLISLAVNPSQQVDHHG